jgi:PAS domain S-box-containing protein
VFVGAPIKSSKTIRIDLLNQGAPEAQPAESATRGAASLLRMNLSMRHRLPPSVARSRYQELLQSVYDAALITTVSGSVIDANVRAVEFLQFEKSELCSLSIYELIAGADASLMDTLSESLTRERFSVIQAYCIRRDGTTFPTEIAVNKLRLDELCLCFLIRDTTIRTQAEQMLRLEHTAIQNAGAGIVIADMSAALEYANPAFARMLDLGNPEDLIGQDLRQWFDESAAAEDLIRHATETAEPQTTETKLRNSGAREIFTSVNVSCTRDTEGEPVGLVFSFTDITAHLRTQEALRDAQELIDRLLAEQVLDTGGAKPPPPAGAGSTQ